MKFNQNKKGLFLVIFIILISVSITSAYAINITLGGTVDITQILNMMGNRITNVGTPITNTDAATKGYVDQSPTTDTLVVLGCTTDQIAKFNETEWVCVDTHSIVPTIYENSATGICGSNCATVSCDAGDTRLGGGVVQDGGFASSIKVSQNGPIGTNSWSGILDSGSAKTTVVCMDTAAPFK